MIAARELIGGLWLVFILTWLVLAAFSKRRRRGAPWRFWGLRLIVIATVLALVRLRGYEPAALTASGYLPRHPGAIVQWTGVGLCIAGFAFAFWARAHIGRNWGTPMTLREDHELVTTGPYRRVRHPIYTGIMLAMLGTALGIDLLWLVLFVVYFVFFLLAARSEERTMLAQFPQRYSEYQRRTKMLIPFLL